MLNPRDYWYRVDRDRRDAPGGKRMFSIAVLGKSEWFGENNTRSHPQMLRRHDLGLESAQMHAEYQALMKVPRQSRASVELYVIRFLFDGTPTMAKPCPMCQGVLAVNGVDFANVFYTDWNGDWQSLRETT